MLALHKLFVRLPLAVLINSMVEATTLEAHV